jgi:hypothetical protein
MYRDTSLHFSICGSRNKTAVSSRASGVWLACSSPLSATLEQLLAVCTSVAFSRSNTPGSTTVEVLVVGCVSVAWSTCAFSFSVIVGELMLATRELMLAKRSLSDALDLGVHPTLARAETLHE